MMEDSSNLSGSGGSSIVKSNTNRINNIKLEKESSLKMSQKMN